MSSRIPCPLALLLACLLTVQAAHATEKADLMQQVFDAIAYLLPLSLREASLGGDWDRELIDEKLSVLENSTAALVAHTKSEDPVSRDLARAFDAQTRDIAQAFREQWPGYAWFSLMGLTQHCAACHARLPARDAGNFGQRLLARIDTSTFDESEVAHLLVAAREFDTALDTLERKLMKETHPAIEMDDAGVLLDYLDIALVVRQDPERADALLARFQARPDVPFYLAQRLAAWRASLKRHGALLAGPASLQAARELFLAADGLTRAPRGKERAVHDLIAANLLQRVIHGTPAAPGEALAEAWYMLGVIALRTTEPRYSVPDMELNLAAAVRAAPRGPHAREAYALLEEFGYWKDQPLSRASTEPGLIDMAALRRLLVP